MVSLNSANIGIDSLRSSPYFNKYEFSLTASVPGIGYFRGIKSLRQFDQRLPANVGYYDRLTVKEKCAANLSILRSIIMWRYTMDRDHNSEKLRITVSGNQLFFYTSDLSLIENFINEIGPNNISYTIKRSPFVPNWEKGAIYHARPKHKLRLYLTSRRYALEEKTELCNYLAENTAHIAPSPTLKNWFTFINRSHSHAWSTMFMDIDDEVYLTYMSLRFSNLISRVCDIKQR
jgi:hypothetical protein